ncbi:MAG: ABC transporter ATP-binding protein [Bdellovibrionaceae bacterium]|nr:ABC transporter ATP-binding protein [Bdellovibrionales bacterium]MCB9086188.1 ABC transporter ATP-binding protein [Pseudobdellovibrionaceae bacterium]
MKIIIERLWPELQPYKLRILIILVLGAIVSGLKAVSPELLRQLEAAWRADDHTKAIQIPIAIAVLWTLSGIARYYHLFWMKFTSDQIAVKLRRDLMNKYLSLNLGFFHRFMRGSGGLISRMISDIQIIQGAIHKVADIVREPFMALLTFAYVLYLDWKLTLFILAALPIITGVMRRLARSLRKYGHKNQEAMEELTKTLKESLDGTRIVQSYNLEGQLRDRFTRQADHFLETQKKIINREELAGPISESLASITLAMILVYIGQQIFSGHLLVGDFIAFSFAIGLLQDSVKKLQASYLKLQQAAVALERMKDIMNTSSTVPDPDSPVPFNETWASIDFKNVSFAFEDEAVLKNVNLSIKRGEVVALVGSSGGGKSTLVNLLERFFDPSSGHIEIGGVDIRKLSIKDLRDHIALVSQDVFLFGDTVKANIRLGDIDKEESLVEGAAKLANAHDFITRTREGYDTRMGDQGALFSGGEKQRISIARAIFKDAPILILDEATSALDSESEVSVQKGLDQLMKGRTAFVIAHRLSTIAKADRILVLKGGRIVEQGSHDDLLNKKGEYFRFHQLQAH